LKVLEKGFHFPQTGNRIAPQKFWNIMQDGLEST